MPPDLTEQIAIGNALSHDGKTQEAAAHFLNLLRDHSQNAELYFELGGVYDYAGFEAKALPQYRRALELGLPPELERRCTVQLGSSLRNVEQHKEAVELLQNAVNKNPDYLPLKIFLALALHSADQSQAALVLLLDVLQADPAQLDGYQRAVKYYVDELRGTAQE